jgi:hypothetical protein
MASSQVPATGGGVVNDKYLIQQRDDALLAAAKHHANCMQMNGLLQSVTTEIAKQSPTCCINALVHVCMIGTSKSYGTRRSVS